MSTIHDQPTLRQTKHTLKIFDQQGITGDLMRLLHDGFLSDFLEGVRLSRRHCLRTRDELRVFLGLLPLKPTLLVDYDLPFDDMVAAGKYDYVDTETDVEKFKHLRIGKGVKEVNIQLACILEGNVNLGENGAEMMFGAKWRLASYEELFAFGATYPKVQLRCNYGIFGKGYRERDSRGLFGLFRPYLWGSIRGERGLSMTPGGIYSNPGTRFLFVEK